jgi:hypothetical protein
VLLALVLCFMLAFPFLVRVTSRCVLHEWEQIVEQRVPPTTLRPSIERVSADLRRLRLQLEMMENRPGTTGKGLKMGAVRAAYIEVLGIACGQLDVRPPECLGSPQPSVAEVYRVEAELRQRGLDVRLPGIRRDAA